MSSLLNPPPDRKSLFDDPKTEPAPPPRQPPQPPEAGGKHRGRRPLAALLVASAFLGGGASTGILAATGAFRDDGGTTITTSSGGVNRTVSNEGALDPGAVYAAAQPGVVDITVKTTSSSAQQQSPFGGVPQPQQQQEATATGTGFVVDEDGHIVTAAHVVDNATSVTVKLADGTTKSAEVLGKDDATDIAVIKIDPSGTTLHPLTLGSSANVKVGDELAAIGDPFGYDRSLSTGIVSGVDRTIEAPNGFTVSHAIQTDAAINPGNSGGPVLDADGNVIGIADQIATDGSAEQSSGVGFAVPIDLVKSSLDTLIAGGKVEHAYMGIATGDSANGASGATVSSVSNGGPAAAAGLRSGDVVTEFDGKAVEDSNDLVAAIAAKKPGDKADVTVKRGGSTQDLTVTLGTQPSQAANGG